MLDIIEINKHVNKRSDLREIINPIQSEGIEYVYIIKVSGKIKLGRTTDLMKRILRKTIRSPDRGST